MKIGFNARCLEYDMSGIERYSREILFGSDASKEISQLHLFSQSPIDISELNVSKTNILNHSSFPLKKKSDPLSKFLWEAITVSKLVSKQEIDIYHAPSFILPLYPLNTCKTVITVHDVAFLKHPEFFDFKTRLYYKALFYSSLKSANKIICISNNTRDDLAFMFPELASKLVVIYNGFENFQCYLPQPSILENYGLLFESYWLSVGTINKRKNLLNSYKAFKNVNDGNHFKLVLVGKDSNLPDYIRYDPQVVLTGFISENELSNLYRYCFGFIFASIYEGFGFPVLEAQSFGKPVICSNNSSLPEVSGYHSDLLVDPLSIESIACLIRNIQSSKDLYNEMSFFGIKNIQRFSWDRMSKETLDCYKSCLA